jgi:hypothetical protein
MAAEFLKPPGRPTAGIAQHDPFFGYDRPQTHG